MGCIKGSVEGHLLAATGQSHFIHAVGEGLVGRMGGRRHVEGAGLTEEVLHVDPVVLHHEGHIGGVFPDDQQGDLYV